MILKDSMISQKLNTDGVGCEERIRTSGPGVRPMLPFSGSLKNSSSLSFLGAEGDEESRISSNFRARFLAPIEMTCSGNVFQRTGERSIRFTSSFAAAILKGTSIVDYGRQRKPDRLRMQYLKAGASTNC